MKKSFYRLAMLLLVFSKMAIAFDGSGSISSGGVNRSFVFHSSGASVASSLPLVIVMHGDGGNGAGIKGYSGFDAIANTNNFIAVYPNALNGSWNRYVDNLPGDAGVGNANAPDDVLFISDLISYFCSTYRIDSKRVYATGHSAGGFMAYNLAVQLPNRIAAFAPVAASVWGNSTFFNGYISGAGYQRVPILHIHGDADGTVSYPDPNHQPDAASWGEYPLSHFAFGNCSKTSYTLPVADLVAGVKKLVFCAGGAGNKEIALIRIVGGGHGWPNVPGWNTAGKIWEFFSNYALAVAPSCTDVAIQINTTLERKAISPLIYGLNPYHYDNSLTGMAVNAPGTGVTSLRFGGDAVSTYNWEKNVNTSWNGSCCNTYSSNDNNRFLAYASGQPSANFGEKAGAPLRLIADANALSAYPLIQISGAQYAAKDFSGCILTPGCGSANISGRLDEIIIQKPTALTLNPDPSDGYVYADEEINYLISQSGSSGSGGAKGYCLENEPGIWHSTHPLNHPIKATCLEVISKNTVLARRIKELDPGAETFGPGMFGFTEYVHLNSQGGWGNPNYYPADWSSYNMSDVGGYNALDYQYMTWVCSYLRRMKMASDTEGKRLLDGLDIHFYNQGNNTLQDSRSFWDSSYVENSWITNDVTGGRPLYLINYLQKAIRDFYPGTKLAVTEWGNFTDYSQFSAGIYTADLLGAFGKNSVYLSTYFGRLMGFPAGAFKIFRNYDGSNAHFGNTSVSSSSADNSKISAYSSIDNADESRLHVVLINRSGSEETAAVTISTGAGVNYQNAEVYALESGSGGSVVQKASVAGITGNALNYQLPAYSVFHLVLNTAPGPLPVALLKFTAERSKENSITLRWETASEVNVDVFQLERSINGNDFSLVSQQKATGDAVTPGQYQFADEGLKPGTYYYRLKSIDLDKSYSYSRMVNALIEKTGDFFISPAPTSDFFFVHNDEGRYPVVVQVYDVMGNLVLQQKRDELSSKFNVSFLTAGLYFVKIEGQGVKRLMIVR